MSKSSQTAPRSRVGRIAAGVGMAVGGAALAAGVLYTELLTTVIARRRTPHTDALMAMATGKEPTPPSPDVAAMAQALRDAPTETVSIRSRDGYVLRAHWYPVENARRVVILIHGWHSAWNLDFSASSPFLRENGCSLLLIDQRSHGESGGDLISYGINERYDVLAWIEWLEQHHPALPIYLCGISMGASTALMTAGLPIGGRVCGIIADCGYSSPNDIIKRTLQRNLGKSAGPSMTAVNLNCKLRGGFTFKDYSPIEAMTANKEVPCLFVHGDADELVPWRMSLENYYACQAPKELWIVHGAGHGMAFLTEPDRYKQRVLDFFAAYDPVPTPPEAQKKRLFGRKRGDA